MILIPGESVSERSESRAVVSDRIQFVMPPRIELAQIFGGALYSAKAVLAGRAGDVWGTHDSSAALETLNGARAPPSLGDLRLLLFERGRQGARDAIALTQVDCGAAPHDERLSHAWRFVSDTPQPRLPFRAPTSWRAVWGRGSASARSADSFKAGSRARLAARTPAEGDNESRWA
jgi:hypothetical protein